MRRRAAIALTTLLASGAAAAQSPIPVGQHVRLTFADGSHHAGWITSADRDSLRLAADPDENVRYWTTVPLARVRSYQLPAGHRRAHGALVGLAVGGTLGLGVLAYGIHADLTTEDVMIPAEIITVPVALALTALGSALGAAAAPARWSPPVRIALDHGDGPRLSPWLHHGSLGIALAMRF